MSGKPPSLWRKASGLALFAAALLPAAAQASVGALEAKAINAKPAAFARNLCRAVTGLAPAASRAAPADEAPSALDRIRMSQQRAAPAAGKPVLVLPAPSPVACTETAAPRAAFDPDSELGTLALAVDHTRFDARWDHVRRAPRTGLMQAELARAGVARGEDEAAVLQRVNQWVNRRIAYVSDDRNDGRADAWATADETLARRSGDCEDFAILKMQLLRAAGIEEARMKLVLLRDLAVNADHALLLVRSAAGGSVVLDNRTDRVYDGREASAVRPILSFSGARRWVHGYRDASPTPVMASVPAAPALAIKSGAAGRPALKTAGLAHRARAFASLAMGAAMPWVFARPRLLDAR